MTVRDTLSGASEFKDIPHGGIFKLEHEKDTCIKIPMVVQDGCRYQNAVSLETGSPRVFDDDCLVKYYPSAVCILTDA